MTPLEIALEALGEYIAKNKHSESAVLHARLRAVMRAYEHRWGDQNRTFEVLAVEKLLVAPLANLNTGKKSEYLAGGKLDVVLRDRERNRLILMDHKLLRWSFDDTDIEHLMIAAQPLEYGYLAWANGRKLDDAMWDVLAKPGHVPRKESSRLVRAAKPERIAARKYTAPDGQEYKKGDTLPAEPEIRETSPAETMEEFEERVFQILIEQKDKYFARPRVPLLKQQVAEHIHEKYMWAQEIKLDAAGEVHLKNTDACKNYNSPCPYMGICLGTSNENDGTWTRTHQVHAELDLPAGVDPHKVITNSRLSTYKLCRKKHHLRYNVGLIKIKTEEEEQLYVGQGGHIALEHYWKALAAYQGRKL